MKTRTLCMVLSSPAFGITNSLPSTCSILLHILQTPLVLSLAAEGPVGTSACFCLRTYSALDSGALWKPLRVGTELWFWVWHPGFAQPPSVYQGRESFGTKLQFPPWHWGPGVGVCLARGGCLVGSALDGHAVGAIHSSQDRETRAF